MWKLAFGLGLVSSVLAIGCGPTATGGNNNQCGFGLTACGGACVNLLSDGDHCGSCFNTCTGTQVCNGLGSCTSDCSGTLTNCGGICADLNSNPSHCGVCNFQCGQNESCAVGRCTDNSCASTTSEAQGGVLPADIILVVDNSGSMTAEAGFVQAAMNDFVGAIVGSGIDAHVILISADSNDSNGICVPPPLGSGNCPADENLPTYRHVNQSVGSSNSLQIILDTYSQWSSSLRPAATKTIAVISDDDSSLSAASFVSQLLALDPSFTGFKFDAIVAPYELSGFDALQCPLASPPNCASVDPCCGVDSSFNFVCMPLPASEGAVYKGLVNSPPAGAVGGVLGDLCQQDFLPVFQDMATAVIADSQVSCIYNIPDPGGGQVINYAQVNVEFRATATSDPELIPNVPGGSTACGPNGGWYYDDPVTPTQILFCPATCTFVEAAPEGRVDVAFGCATVVQ